MAHTLSIAAMLFAFTSTLVAQERVPAELLEGRVAWEDVSSEELKLVDAMLTSQHWSSRVFGLLRLERYKGEKVGQYINAAMEDTDWHVRCFALRAAVRMEVEVSKDLLARETDARVVRTALRLGLDPGDAVVDRVMKKEIAARSPDRLLLAVEIGAAARKESTRKAAAGWIVRIIENMDSKLAVLAGERMTRLLGLSADPITDVRWKAWLASKNGQVTLPEPPEEPEMLKDSLPWIATISEEKLAELMNYLSDLRKKEVDLVIVMDATGSMGSVIRRTQSEADRLIIIMNDLSKSMQLGVVAYRDRMDLKPVESHELSRYINQVREFLFGIKAEGGGDLPEAVLEGLKATPKLGWRRSSEKQIVIVGDAPSHAADAEAMTELLEGFRKRNTSVHTVAITNSAETIASFKQIAKESGGQFVALTDISDLGKVILQLSLHERAKPAAGDFYDLYVKLCM